MVLETISTEKTTELSQLVYMTKQNKTKRLVWFKERYPAPLMIEELGRLTWMNE